MTGEGWASVFITQVSRTMGFKISFARKFCIVCNRRSEPRMFLQLHHSSNLLYIMRPVSSIIESTEDQFKENFQLSVELGWINSRKTPLKSILIRKTHCVSWASHYASIYPHAPWVYWKRHRYSALHL